MNLARVEVLFHEVVELPPDERSAWIEEKVDAEHRSALLRLIASHDQAASDGFMEPPETEPSGSALIGRRIGNCTVRSLVAVGGMGAVYEAQQDEPRRSVAIKIMRTALRTPEALRRFEFEREVLGRLQHPGIAQIHAAGTYDDPNAPGAPCPYFVMEFVPEATTLLQFCSRTDLDRRRRIELFLGVCEAITHGHQRGVLHRDIKPANILIDVSSGPTPQAKVIDFGVARLTEHDGRAQSTEAGQLLGTLAYMSPEQTEADTDIDARSDVYSLGVVLFELLTDQRPHDVNDVPLTRAIAAIQSDPPRRPSSIKPDLIGDLETIILRALEKDPDRRYATVSELAGDLRRFLAHEPINARPPSVTYQLRLLARRQRAPFAAGVLALLALVTAAVVSTVFAIRSNAHAEAERRQRYVAEEATTAMTEALARADALAVSEREQRITAESVTALLTEALESQRPAVSLGRELTVRELVDRAAASAEQTLAERPAALAHMLLTLGVTQRSLGRFDEAHALLTRSLEIRESLSDADDPALAHVLNEIGWNHALQRQVEPAMEALRRAEAIGGDIRLRIELLLRMATIVGTLSGETEEGLELLERSVALAESSDSQTDLVTILTTRGDVLYAGRRVEAAEEAFARAHALADAVLPANHPDRAKALNNHGNTLFDLGRFEEGAACWREALAIMREILPADHADLATVIQNLSLEHKRKLKYDRALALSEEALAIRRRVYGDENPRVARLLGDQSVLLADMGELDRAAASVRESIRLLRISHERGDTSLGTLATWLNQGAFTLFRCGRLDEAEEVAAEALQIFEDNVGPDHVLTARVLAVQAGIRLGQARYEEAEVAARRSWTIRQAEMPDHWLASNSASVLGECLLRLGRADEARSLLNDADAKLAATLGPDHPRRLESVGRLLVLAELDGNAERAAELRAILGHH